MRALVGGFALFLLHAGTAHAEALTFEVGARSSVVLVVPITALSLGVAGERPIFGASEPGLFSSVVLRGDLFAGGLYVGAPAGAVMGAGLGEALLRFGWQRDRWRAFMDAGPGVSLGAMAFPESSFNDERGRVEYSLKPQFGVSLCGYLGVGASVPLGPVTLSMRMGNRLGVVGTALGTPPAPVPLPAGSAELHFGIGLPL